MTTLLQCPLGLKSKAFLLSALVFGILQIWRPCFFLTDDTLSGGMPIFDELGRHMWAGQPIGYSDYIFGGNYRMVPDPMFFIWAPCYLFVAFLCPVIGVFYYADLLAFFDLQLAIIGFVTLGEFLRREYALKLSDWRLLFYALSFNFNLYILDGGSSWGSFLVNHSVLPWLVLALMQKTFRSGWAMASLGLTHELVAGHFVMTISNGILLSI